MSRLPRYTLQRPPAGKKLAHGWISRCNWFIIWKDGKAERPDEERDSQIGHWLRLDRL